MCIGRQKECNSRAEMFCQVSETKGRLGLTRDINLQSVPQVFVDHGAIVLPLRDPIALMIEKSDDVWVFL